jgi:hypothetical protein
MVWFIVGWFSFGLEFIGLVLLLKLLIFLEEVCVDGWVVDPVLVSIRH